MPLPSVPHPDNATRASWAISGLKAFGRESGQDAPAYLTDPVAMAEIVADFLCDTMHLLALHRVDIAAVHARARGHFLEERAEEIGPVNPAAEPGPDPLAMLHEIRRILATDQNDAARLDDVAAVYDDHGWYSDTNPWRS